MMGYNVALLKLTPYKHDFDSLLAASTSLALLLTSLGGFCLVTDHPYENNDQKSWFNTEQMGVVLIVVNLLLPFCTVFYSGWLYRYRNADGDGRAKGLGEENDGGSIEASRSLVKVVPTSQEVERTLKKHIAALKWQKNIRQTLVNNVPKNQASKLGRVKSTRTRKVEEIEKNHQSYRNMAVQNIKQQQVQRRNSLQLRVQARNQKKHLEETAASDKVKKEATGASVQQTETEDGATARKWLCKIGVKKTWKFVSKNIQQNKEKQSMLNRATVVNLFKKLKMVEPDEFLSRQFGTPPPGHIEAHVFMAWVFEAEIQTGKIERQQVEDAINGTKYSTAVFSRFLARPNDTIGYPVLDE
jgi:hypothetical protein